MAEDRPWCFDDFEPGAALGCATFTVDDVFVERWLALYEGEPDTRPELPAGMTMPIVMRGYTEAVSPRPPGNVHAGQQLTIHRSPRVGERLTTTVWCQGKVLRSGRRWTRHGVRTNGDGDEARYEGVITILWSR